MPSIREIGIVQLSLFETSIVPMLKSALNEALAEARALK